MVTDMLGRKGYMSTSAPTPRSIEQGCEKGSLDGQRVWKRVLAAVREIQRKEPREGEAAN